MVLRVFALLFVISFVGCNNCIFGQAIKDADLIFSLGASSSMDNAIVDATDRGEGAVVHVGIIAIIDDVPSVIEAIPEEGVTVTPLSTFICKSRVSSSLSPCVKIMRVEDIDQQSVVKRALAYVGRPYDHVYSPGDDALYCSELVYECFFDADGEHVFEAAPMNFYAPDGTLPEYWQALFASTGVKLPQGVPGTNPAAMSVSPRLTPVLSL